MKSMCRHIILRTALVLSLVFQSLMPVSLVMAAEAGYDVSAFMCSPSTKAPSAQAEAHIQDLMRIIEGGGSKDPLPSSFDHCSSCVIAIDDIGLEPLRCLSSSRFEFLENTYLSDSLYILPTTRAPPLGSRAPPRLL